MPWFKVDDGLTSKSETTRIPRSHRRAAIGIWALAGSWSAKELTDGHIPEHMLEELSGTQEDAEWLVAAGFWRTVDDGWQFVEWEPDQPLREVVLAERKKKADKMRDWRSRNKPSEPASNPATGTATSPASDAAVTPAPTQTRPDPDLSTNKHDYSTEFEEFWLVYPRRQAKSDAAKAYSVVRKTTEASEILAGAQAYALLNIETEKAFLKLPAGWLRGERWNDDPIPAAAHAQTPEERARQTLSIGTKPKRRFTAHDDTPSIGPGAVTADEEYCPQHPFYPVSSWRPCAACTEALAEGVNF